MNDRKIPVVVKVHASEACAKAEQGRLPPGSISRIVSRQLDYLGIKVRVWLLVHPVIPELKTSADRTEEWSLKAAP